VDDLISASGTYLYNGDYEISNQEIPNDYDNVIFDQVVFINGNLRISNDIDIAPQSSALFVVSGNVEIDKNTDNVDVGIFADGMFYTAYNVNEGEASRTLNLNGVYYADEFVFQRTLQGTNNDNDPSEKFTYEPKYTIQLRDFFGERHIVWVSVD
ncbi:MAG: hypothetical protein R3250_16030, partial [Melioribacteraceae bacterium]|nr:hypothetical protein [Melioribacteraceae bacterium]